MFRKGVLPHLIPLILTWLANRQDWVAIEGLRSKKTILKQGVPQGSVISPLLFLFYIDDLHWGPGDLHVSLFADDVAIWALDIILHVAERRLQQVLDVVTTWSKDWNIILSAKTSECRFFSHESKCQPTLTLDGQPVCYIATPKFLGVTYDRQLTFSCHAALVDNSLKRQVGAL